MAISTSPASYPQRLVLEHIRLTFVSPVMSMVKSMIIVNVWKSAQCPKCHFCCSLFGDKLDIKGGINTTKMICHLKMWCAVP